MIEKLGTVSVPRLNKEYKTLYKNFSLRFEIRTKNMGESVFKCELTGKTFACEETLEAFKVRPIFRRKVVTSV